jgi:tetratricopeptide (TPR) repeat protein
VYTRLAPPMQFPLPAPTAEGTFGKTPFPHLLVYAMDRTLSGTFAFRLGGERVATLLVASGFPAKARTAAEESGAVASPAIESPASLESKLEHLFSLPPETTYAYYDSVDALRAHGGPPAPIDPLAALWRGVRMAPSAEHVEATLRRVGGAALRLKPTAEPERFRFSAVEATVVELLREAPMRLADLYEAGLLGPEVVQRLSYCLVITKQADLVNAPSQRPPQAGQAFARVQLQPKTVQRAPVIVEEAPVVTRSSDNRISTPGGLLRASPPPDGPEAIAELITETIRSSLPPPLASPLPAPPSTPPPALTAEQNALKAKILERAAQISSQDYFQMLGVDAQSPPEAVQSAFIALAKVWHPDRLPAVLLDVKDACSKVFAHLTEAHATLADPGRRAEYMTLIKDGGATPKDQAKIQSVIEAATEYQKAEIVLRRNDTAQAYELVSRAHELDPEQVEYLAMMTWLEAQRPEWLGREKTLEKIAVIDRCLKKNPNSERMLFWRGMLYKRIDDGAKAIKDFKKVAELNPRNLDAMREVRLYVMRGGSKPPPGPDARSSKPPPEPRGGLFGKLFKK